MEQKVYALSNTNDAPTEELISHVKKEISDPLTTKISDLEQEILQLRKHIEQVKNKQKEAKKCLKRYQRVLSPARRIPFDVLQEIFLHCLPDDRNPSICGTDAPMLLTRVCATWRKVCFACPRLWTRLHISSFNSNQPFLRRALNEQAIQRLCKIVPEWLSRSGDCTIFISIESKQHDSPQENPLLPESSKTERRVLNTLLPFMHRCGDLDLNGDFDEFGKMISPATLTRLRSLKIRFRQSILQHEAPKQEQQLMQAPNLRMLTLNAHWNLKNIPLDSTDLTSINFSHVECSHQDVLAALQCLPRLRHCKLALSDPEQAAELIPVPVSLPSLSSLNILERANAPNSEKFFYCLDLPFLRCMEYRTPILNNLKQLRLGGPNPILSDGFLFAPLAMVEKSSFKHLTKLTILPNVNSNQLRKCFRMLPSITSLIIGEETTSTEEGKLLAMEEVLGLPLTREHFKLDLLTAPGKKKLKTFEDKEGQVLLPNLQFIEIHESRSITDEGVLQFSLSRLRPNLKLRIAVLQSVKVSFRRQQQQEIASKIKRRAAEIGADVFLSLSYPSTRPFLVPL